MEKLNVSYSTIKQILNTAPSYYILQGDGGYIIYVVGEQLFTASTIMGTDTTSINNFENNHKSSCISVPSADDALILGNIANEIPLISPRTNDGRIRIVSEKTNASTITIYSHDWANPTTWYSNSIFVSNEILSNPSNDGYTFIASHNNIIDTYHGKITAEDYLLDSDGYSYRVNISVDGYSKTEQDPHYGIGGDFIVNYNDGYILFNDILDPSSVVKITYHYGVDSTFIVKPTAGKQLRVNEVEVQFSQDIILTDSAIFQPYMYVDVVAPQLLISNGGIFPSGTKIPVTNPLIYKTMADYLGDAKKSYPNYKPISAENWRGMSCEAVTMHWDYDAQKVLRSDYGMEIRISLQHNTPFTGTFATATFYCMTEDIT